ncbi:membrane protein insertion efficiency factor YidD [Gordonia sp. NPDC003424]
MSGTRSVAGWLHLLPRRIVIFLIELYRTWVSPMRLPSCRFEPTCSAYAVEAISRHGLIYGSDLAIIRLLKCGPWHKPGYDPVPERGLRELLHFRAVPTEVRGN